jgi:pimeloyl-ACP methyl ester carboxylesterase
VIAPDQRGYNLSDKLQGIASYRMEILMADILGLADTLRYERFHLAGHDWGAMVGPSHGLGPTSAPGYKRTPRSRQKRLDV